MEINSGNFTVNSNMYDKRYAPWKLSEVRHGSAFVPNPRAVTNNAGHGRGQSPVLAPQLGAMF